MSFGVLARRILVVSAVLSLIGLFLFSNLTGSSAQTPTGNPGSTNPQNNVGENGITVGKPKQFDERTLTAMLRDLENKLTRSQFPDPTGLYSSTGRFAGATATTTSLGLSIRGPSTPSVMTTVGSSDKDTSGSKTTEGSEKTETVGGKDPSTTTKATTSNETTSGGETTSTNQVVTTQGSFAPPTATTPAQTSNFAFQPQFGISAQDLLAEQTSLFYQIVNLRLLLDRSITDRLEIQYEKKDNRTTLVKRDQYVVGFQISIDAAHKDAVAEAEITIKANDVSLVSLMPQDKTYNVASVTKDAKVIDVGAVVQFIGVGANIGKTQESLYLVKDTDTVALQRNAGDGLAKFAWQFRPVLGRRAVEPGSRQVFALISLPAGADQNLQITAVTKWRHYDRKTKIVGGLINGDTELSQYTDAPLTIGTQFTTEYSLKHRIDDVKWNDMGNGQVLVVVEGDGFTPDTSIVLGNTVLNGPDKGLTVASEKRLIVVTQGQLLAQSPSPPIIVGRYGTIDFQRARCLPDERPPVVLGATFSVLTPNTCGALGHENNTPYSDLQMMPATVRAHDAQSFEVTLRLEAKRLNVNIEKLFQRHPPVVVIGGKVFGLSDAPFIARNFKAQAGQMPSVELTFVAPAQVLTDSKTFAFREFLWNQGELTGDLLIPGSFSATSVVTLGSNGEKTQLAITGAGFSKEVRVMVGETEFGVSCDGRSGCVKGLTLNASDGSATVITLSPTKAQIKDVKQILVMQGTAQPRSLALTAPPPTTPTAKIISPKDPLTLDEGDSVLVKFEGANFESIQKVLFEGKELSSKPDPEDKTVRFVEVTTAVTAKKGKKRLVFVMKDDKEVPFNITVK